MTTQPTLGTGGVVAPRSHLTNPLPWPASRRTVVPVQRRSKGNDREPVADQQTAAARAARLFGRARPGATHIACRYRIIVPGQVAHVARFSVPRVPPPGN